MDSVVCLGLVMRTLFISIKIHSFNDSATIYPLHYVLMFQKARFVVIVVAVF